MPKTLLRSLVPLIALAVVAGCAPSPPEEEVAAEPAGDPNPISMSLKDAWATARLNLRESSEQMEAAGYAFQPTADVRTFGQLLTHVAGANYTFCSAALGEASPNGEDSFEDTVTDRAEIIRVLEESLAYCDRAYDAATDASLSDTVEQPFGGGSGPRSAVLIGNIVHLNEHYGNLVTYFRINGLVPPSSRR